ncbi:hypothetical protein RUM44_013689 [Polyplax serrata]|uniref:Uncharacterized protein n=1 Tax=Polyplax serrata TaxID=468196 RepID=A0ABR1BEV3_POLSC
MPSKSRSDFFSFIKNFVVLIPQAVEVLEEVLKAVINCSDWNKRCKANKEFRIPRGTIGSKVAKKEEGGKYHARHDRIYLTETGRDDLIMAMGSLN